MTETSTPRSSRDAMVRKASPRAKAQGALQRLSRTENQAASEVLPLLVHRHPPMATSSPSALASRRKTAPRSFLFAAQLLILLLLISSARKWIMSSTIGGVLGLA